MNREFSRFIAVAVAFDLISLKVECKAGNGELFLFIVLT